MDNENNFYEEIDYVEYEGNRFLIDEGILKDVQVQEKVVRVPESVREIRRQAFLDARLLGTMELLIVPASVKKIDRLAFAGMPRLKQVNLYAGIVTMEQGLFRNCMELEEILLPDTLRKIESRAFENCIKLKIVEFPRAWVQMEEDSFLNCVQLKEKRIEQGMEEAEYRRKKEEEAVRKARFPHLFKEKEKAKEPKTEVKLQETVKKEEKIQEPQAKSAAEELLEAALLAEQQAENQKTVTVSAVPEKTEQNEAHLCIHEGVLERCEVYGNSVKIPEGVTALADRVFFGMDNLEEIIFPSTLSYIGVQALEGTGWLAREREQNRYVVVNGILVSAFYNSMVVEAKLPNNIYRIAPYAFYRSEAQLVTLPESVREIDSRAFVECGVTEIDFSSRADVVIHTPLAVRCAVLRELYFQGMLDRLEANFVEDCPALKRVCLKWPQTVVSKNAFPESVRIWVI